MSHVSINAAATDGSGVERGVSLRHGPMLLKQARRRAAREADERRTATRSAAMPSRQVYGKSKPTDRCRDGEHDPIGELA